MAAASDDAAQKPRGLSVSRRRRQSPHLRNCSAAAWLTPLSSTLGRHPRPAPVQGGGQRRAERVRVFSRLQGTLRCKSPGALPRRPGAPRTGLEAAMRAPHPEAARREEAAVAPRAAGCPGIGVVSRGAIIPRVHFQPEPTKKLHRPIAGAPGWLMIRRGKMGNFCGENGNRKTCGSRGRCVGSYPHEACLLNSAQCKPLGSQQLQPTHQCLGTSKNNRRQRSLRRRHYTNAPCT